MGRGIVILSHKRPDSVKTLKALRRLGYDGPFVIVVDDKDPTLSRYKELYPDNLFIFSKAAIAKEIDVMDQGGTDKVVLFARQAAWYAAEEFGFDEFLELDDDYEWFAFVRTPEGRFHAKGLTVARLPATQVFNAYWDALASMPPRVLTIAISQTGDYMHKRQDVPWSFPRNRLRKAMNAFFLRLDRRFDWIGRFNEDVNAYVYLGGLGWVFLTHPYVVLGQEDTQTGKGGMTEAYAKVGTYQKSFYTVMLRPDAVAISVMGMDHHRLHHRIDWDLAVPKIIRPVEHNQEVNDG